jgi:hypothetical protein
MIQKSIALLKIVSCGALNLTPIFCIIGMPEMPFLLLIQGLLTMVATIFMISPVNCVDLSIFLLLQGPLAAGLKELSLGLGSLYAYNYDCEQIGHIHGLLHGDLLHSLEIANPIRKAFMISMSWMYGMAFLALQKYFT